MRMPTTTLTTNKGKPLGADTQSLAALAFLRREAGMDLTREQRSALSDHAEAFDRSLGRDGDDACEGVFPFLLGERRAMSGVVGPSGGYLIPNGDIVAGIERGLDLHSPVRQVAEVIQTPTGADLAWPVADDTDSEGDIVPQGGTLAQGDITTGRMMLGCSKFTSKILKVPIELFEDLPPGCLNDIWVVLGERVSRRQNRAYTVGTGTGEPAGFITKGALGATAASAATIAYEDAVNLLDSLDPGYRSLATFQAHPSIITVLRKVKDGSGEPVLGGEGRSPTLLGYPLLPNLHMASSCATGNKTLAVANFQKYKIREVRQAELVVMREAYIEAGCLGLYVRMRADGNLADGGQHPVRFLQHP